MPLVQKCQAPGEATTVLLDLEKQRLDILLILIVVGIDGRMAYKVRCSGNLASWWWLVIEAESNSIKVPGIRCQ
jgi:hypothetical protein